jgi:hypothetical protein
MNSRLSIAVAHHNRRTYERNKQATERDRNKFYALLAGDLMEIKPTSSGPVG